MSFQARKTSVHLRTQFKIL